MQGPEDVTIRQAAGDDWAVMPWLWQLFRYDLAPVVHGLPHSDGRYQRGPLEAFPSADGAGYLAWQPHPRTGEDAPVGFVLVDGVEGARRSVVGFWVAPVVRCQGVGQLLAVDVLGRHDGPWSIGFQHDNVEAGVFWRGIADLVFGPGSWTERRQPVPGIPEAPADHVIESGPPAE